ncbi:MAG: hypothetical protein WCE45_04340 [Sedimentisphaerales bacterium]
MKWRKFKSGNPSAARRSLLLFIWFCDIAGCRIDLHPRCNFLSYSMPQLICAPLSGIRITGRDKSAIYS